MTVFGFEARPETYVFLKPNVTPAAARECGFDFDSRPRPSWDTYASSLEFASPVRRDLRGLRIVR